VSAPSLTWRIDLETLNAARARLPRLAQVFVALTVIGVLFRALVWLLQALFHTDAAQQQTDIFVLHDLVILLPAIILWRRPTAATDTPFVLWGAMGLAMVTFLFGPIAPFVGLPIVKGYGSGTQTVLKAAIETASWILIGGGLARLNRPSPRPTIAGFANLLAGALVLASLVGLLVEIASAIAQTRQFVHIEWAIVIVSMTTTFAYPFGVAYFARAVARGLDDPNRAEIAIRLGTAAVGLEIVPLVIAPLAFALATALHWRGLPAGAFATLGVMSDIGFVMLLAAFGLGLADPLRPMAKDWEAVSPALV
jgi:hypothetical protein